jgi:hypothetical protein
VDVDVDVAWDEVTPASWDEELVKWRWEDRLDASGKLLIAYTLHGACPRCGHEDAIDHDFRLQTILDRSTTPPPVINREVYIECACTGEHAQRPAGQAGCGARSSIQFSIPNRP